MSDISRQAERYRKQILDGDIHVRDVDIRKPKRKGCFEHLLWNDDDCNNCRSRARMSEDDREHSDAMNMLKRAQYDYDDEQKEKEKEKKAERKSKAAKDRAEKDKAEKDQAEKDDAEREQTRRTAREAAASGASYQRQHLPKSLFPDYEVPYVRGGHTFSTATPSFPPTTPEQVAAFEASQAAGKGRPSGEEIGPMILRYAVMAGVMASVSTSSASVATHVYAAAAMLLVTVATTVLPYNWFTYYARLLLLAGASINVVFALGGVAGVGFVVAFALMVLMFFREPTFGQAYRQRGWLYNLFSARRSDPHTK